MSKDANVTIVPALPDDLSIVRDILDEAARRLLARGIKQWGVGMFDPLELAFWIERGEMFLARRDPRGEVVGTFALIPSDVLVWGERPDDAGYVHRLAARDNQPGLGKAMLEWAANRTRQAGRAYLRLDCLASNTVLRAYYERLGFVPRGERGMDWGCVARYEKQL